MTPTFNRKPLIIAGLVVGVLIIGLIALSGTKRTSGSLQEGEIPNPSASPSGKPTSSPVAGTTATPVPTPVVVEKPTFSGVDALVNRGLSAGQAENVKTAYYNYIVSSKQSINSVSILTDTIKKDPHDPSSASSIYTLHFNTSYSNNLFTDTQLDYSDFTTIRLRLFNPVSKALIYDSGNLIAQ